MCPEKLCKYKSGIGISWRIREFTLKACAKVVAATGGDVFVRLVVTFLRRTPRCIKAAKVRALLPIKEIGPDGRSSIDLPLLLTDGGVSSTWIKQRKWVTDRKWKWKDWKNRLEYLQCYRDLVFGVDHAAVCESQSAEQVLFPLFPPLFVCLSNEESWDPSR